MNPLSPSALKTLTRELYAIRDEYKPTMAKSAIKNLMENGQITDEEITKHRERESHIPESLRPRLEQARATMESRMRYVEITNTPNPGDFIKAGVDFARLKDEFTKLEAETGEPPQVLITAHLPLSPGYTEQTTTDPDGNSVEKLIPNNTPSFRTMLANMTADKTIPNNPLEYYADDGTGRGPGLYAGNNIYNETNSQFHTQEIALIKQEAAAGNCHYVERDGIIYTLGLISATNKPQDTNTDHTAHQDEHSTISTLLTQNIDRILRGEKLVDVDTWTWAYGNYGSHAADVDWGPGGGRLGVRDRGAGGRSGYLGFRRRVWG